MAHRKDKKSAKEEKIPQPLLLAEKWAKQLGNKVQWSEGILPDGKKVKVLQINHGPIPVWVKNDGQVITVLIPMEIPENISNELSKIEEIKQQKLLFSLKNQLLSYGPIGYSIEPHNSNKISEVKRVAISECIRISTNDPSSFNRFADAIQEVVSAVSSVGLIFGIVSQDTAKPDVLKREAPPDMYR